MEDPKGNSYYLEIEEWFINRIKEVLGDSNLEADVDFFAGDTNTREDLVVLEQKANRKTQILVGFRERSSENASTRSEYRVNTLTYDIYIAVVSNRSKIEMQQKVYPYIMLIENTFDGAEGPVLADGKARVKDVINLPQAFRAIDVSGFQLWHFPAFVDIKRELQRPE